MELEKGSRWRLYFIIAIILIFATSLSYEVARQNMSNPNVMFVFVLDFVTAVIIMSAITWVEVWYILRDAKKKAKKR